MPSKAATLKRTRAQRIPFRPGVPTPTKAGYIRADQFCLPHFSLAKRRRTIHSPTFGSTTAGVGNGSVTPPRQPECVQPKSGITFCSEESEQEANLNIGGKVVTAMLADGATALDLVSVLPLSVSMNDLFGREKYGDLPKALSEDGPKMSRYEVGDIAYLSPETSSLSITTRMANLYGLSEGDD
jgi:hypothetical protein